MISPRLALGVLALILLAATLLLFSYPAIPQDPAYHNFADTRLLLGVPHFWNVASNLAFMVAGVLGIGRLLAGNAVLLPGTRTMAWVFFVGTALVALGSGYYHLNPNNGTLLWDRLPMTLGFMSLAAIVIAEFIQPAAGQRLFYPLLLLGIVSVFYWYYTESQGQGDLRLYACGAIFHPVGGVIAASVIQARF